MAKSYTVKVDGQPRTIEAASPEEAIRKAHTQIQLEMRQQPAAPKPEPTFEDVQRQYGNAPGYTKLGGRGLGTPGTPPTVEEPQPDISAEPTFQDVQSRYGNAPGFTKLGGRGTGQPYTTPEANVGTLTGVMRTAPAFIPGPFKSAGVQGLAEAGAQGIEKGMGMRDEMDPLQIILATALGPLIHSIVAGPGAIKRSYQRLAPAGFEKAHQQAIDASKGLVRQVGPVGGALEGAGKVVQEAENEMVPVTETIRRYAPRRAMSKARSLNEEEGALVQKTVENIRSKMHPTGDMTLADLEAVRKEIGPYTRRSENLSHIYGGIITDLEQKAAAGGTGAQAARDLAAAYKQTLGAASLEDITIDATIPRNVAGSRTDLFDMGRFRKLVREDRANLTSKLGPEGMQAIDAFSERFKTLPPEMAGTAWNSFRSLVMSAAGSAGGAYAGQATGVGPAAGAAIGAALPYGKEFAQNLGIVMRNPQQWQQIMGQVATAVSQGARQAAFPAERPEE